MSTNGAGSNQEGNAQEVQLLRQQLKAMRERVDQDLAAIDAHLVRLLPRSAVEPRQLVTNWKQEVSTW